ncbi:unnamed protein product [Orchesella dallaii]|uniref:Secreted protein n=1 Tax=Orchesella dallaii TaxID=48710 RepID=A0ABP1Q2X9_9HEXA
MSLCCCFLLVLEELLPPLLKLLHPFLTQFVQKSKACQKSQEQEKRTCSSCYLVLTAAEEQEQNSTFLLRTGRLRRRRKETSWWWCWSYVDVDASSSFRQDRCSRRTDFCHFCLYSDHKKWKARTNENVSSYNMKTFFNFWIP